MSKIHDINKITKMNGGISYGNISDKLIKQMLDSNDYDINLKSDTWVNTDIGHAKRIAGIINKILQSTEFTIEMFWHPLVPYRGVIYDGHHRLRAYQYLKKDIPCYLIEEPFYPDKIIY